jgi:transcription factor SPN1
MDDQDLPIDEDVNPVLSDSELSDVDEEAYAGIDTTRIGVESDEDEGPNVFALRPAKVKTGTGERKKRRAVEDTEERRRKREERQGRRLEKEATRKRKERTKEVEDDDRPDPSRRPDDPEEARKWDLERAMDMAVIRKQVKRRKKDDEVDLDTVEGHKIKELKSAMEDAADKDFDAIKNKLPATTKLAMLPTVEAILSKSSLHEALLDDLLLMTIRRWLEPLPDRSLPAYSIQRSLLTALTKLPISKEHLAESGIGKIIIFYRNSPRVEQSIRRIADSLWVEWSRPILKKSSNFRDRQILTASYDSSMALPVLKNSTGPDPRRTVIPHTIRSKFEIAPHVVIDPASVPTSRTSKVENSDLFKRLQSKLQSRNKGKKDGGVSIQGGLR